MPDTIASLAASLLPLGLRLVDFGLEASDGPAGRFRVELDAAGGGARESEAALAVVAVWLEPRGDAWFALLLGDEGEEISVGSAGEQVEAIVDAFRALLAGDEEAADARRAAFAWGA